MKKTLMIVGFFVSLNACSGGNDDATLSVPPQTHTYRYLALGDSYTYGESVCPTCRFPEQLKTRLQPELGANATIDLDMIAVTGWTTNDLLHAIDDENPRNDYDLVTLLIGVNNQYQHKPFSVYESEFPQLVNRAVALAKGATNHVIVVSIPDYAYTPFGQGSPDPAQISAEIDGYNDFARDYCLAHNITFIDITDITRHGIENPELVASDGLHPSKAAYAQFAARILPKALSVLH